MRFPCCHISTFPCSCCQKIALDASPSHTLSRGKWPRAVLPHLLPLKLFGRHWEARQSGAPPVKTGCELRGSSPITFPLRASGTWETYFNSSYLCPSQDLLHCLPCRKPSIKQNFLEAIMKCRLIAIEVFSPFLFISCGCTCFLSEFIHSCSSVTRWLWRKRKK